MHQTRKGRQWFFGMKLHIGTDARTGLVHSVHTTAAHVSDVTEAHRLLHGGETAAWGDAGYQGAEKRPEHAGVGVRWRVAMRPGRRRQLAPGGAKASVRAEHPFLDVKRRFGYAKVRYRGLEKNRQRLARCWASRTVASRAAVIAGAVRPAAPAEALPERHGGETTPGPPYRAPTARLGTLIDAHRARCSDHP